MACIPGSCPLGWLCIICVTTSGRVGRCFPTRTPRIFFVSPILRIRKHHPLAYRSGRTADRAGAGLHGKVLCAGTAYTFACPSRKQVTRDSGQIHDDGGGGSRAGHTRCTAPGVGCTLLERQRGRHQSQGGGGRFGRRCCALKACVKKCSSKKEKKRAHGPPSQVHPSQPTDLRAMLVRTARTP